MPAPKIVLVTLPADGSWTDAIETFGYLWMTLMIAHGAPPDNLSMLLETSADGIVWGDYEGAHPLTLVLVSNWHGSSNLFDSANGSPNETTLRAPYFRFAAGDTDSRGKSFYLYCL